MGLAAKALLEVLAAGALICTAVGACRLTTGSEGGDNRRKWFMDSFQSK